MFLNFEDRPSDSSIVERVWRSRSERGGRFVSIAATNFEMAVTRVAGRTSLTLRGPETKATISGDDGPPKVPLKVNAKYPESEPLPTVPPNLLARLPRLPEDVEYRIVGKNLILRDVDANIIVDFIPNAIR